MIYVIFKATRLIIQPPHVKLATRNDIYEHKKIKFRLRFAFTQKYYGNY